MEHRRLVDRLGALRDEVRFVVGAGVDLGGLPAILATAYGTRPAIVADAPSPGLPERRIRTYADLEEDTARVAAAHEARGIGRGARVVLAIANRVDVLLHVFALVRTGAIPIPANPRLKPAEFAEVVRASGATAIVADRDLAAALAPDGVAPNGARWSWAEDDVGAWLHANPGARLGPTRRMKPDETALLLATSGTTGHPKVAALTSAGVLGAVRRMLLLPVGRERGLRAGRDALVCALPLAHAMGIATFLGALVAGVRVLFHERFQARAILDAIEAERPNVFVGVPTMYADLEAEGAAHSDLRSVQLWISAADVMPPERARRFQGYGAAGNIRGRAFGTALFADVYGMVELSGAAAINLYPPSPLRDVEVPPIAFLLPGFEARVVGEDGRPLHYGTTGALQLRGPGVLRGYEGKPEAGPLPGGWFPTGDLAKVWPGGFYTFMGRSRDRLKVGGFSVFPAEVETILREHPDVGEVVLVGVPDERWGERPVALVIPKRQPFDEKAFVDWAATKVAGYRRPRAALAVDALPRGHNGKIDRGAATKIAIAKLG